MDPVDDPEKPVKRILEYENLCLIFEKTNLSAALKLVKYGHPNFYFAVLQAIRSY
jgi:hypothetical protein